MKRKSIFLMLIALILVGFSHASPSAVDILSKCIVRHGGYEKLQKIERISLKVKVRNYNDQSDIETSVWYHYLSPKYIRIEATSSSMDERMVRSWDQEQARALIRGTTEVSKDPTHIDEMKQCDRMVKMILLNKFWDKDAFCEYVELRKRGKKEVHVIRWWKTETNEEYQLFLSKKYTLLGVGFKEKDIQYYMFFSKHRRKNGCLFPRSIKVYKQEGKNCSIMNSCKVRSIKVNRLMNGRSFFTNLREWPRYSKR